MIYDTNKLQSFPIQPGVYLMKNESGVVLYVGKAKNLRQRIKQYFSVSGDGRLMIPHLISKVADIEFIIVSSEKESLLLENTLIKEFKPKYNALLKDDKSCAALKINRKQQWPSVQLVRYKGKPEPNGLYFGPYTSALAARATLDLLNKLFPLRQCSDQELRRRTRPCILYEMGRCIAPCVNLCTKEEYEGHVERTIKFLRGQDKEVLKELYREMQDLADRLEFEKADQRLKTIRQIESSIEQQKVDKPLGSDSDVFAIFRQGEEVVLTQLSIRHGKLMGSRHYRFENLIQDDRELLESFLLQHYDQREEAPHEILLPIVLDQSEVIAEILGSEKAHKIHLYCPQKGEKRALVEMAYANAMAAFKKEIDAKLIREKTLLEMQQRLRLNRYPNRIECFDNSHISGSEFVATMVVFSEGEKDPKRYRKYKIKEAEASDDYAALREVLIRRYKRAKEENDLPDLLVIDGGKGHLNVALRALAELDIVSVNVIGFAKEEGRHDRGMTAEQIFLPNVKDPILLKHTSSILFLLQQIRDEAHRTAISFHRQRRSKAVISSVLDEIPGIGPVKRKELLRYFGSVKKLKVATKEELEKVPGLSEANVLSIIEFFRTHLK